MAANDPSGEISPESSMMASAGSPARTAAVRIASTSSASYRQNVLRLSADRNEVSQRTPASSLMRLISAAVSGVASSRSANRRSTMNTGGASVRRATAVSYTHLTL